MSRISHDRTGPRIFGLLVAVATALTLATLPEQATPAQADPNGAPPAEYHYLDALHVLPPMKPGGTAGPTNDATLLDDLTISICRQDADGCTPVDTITSSTESNGPLNHGETLQYQSPPSNRYHATWKHSGATNGQKFTLSFVVDGLHLGSVTETASSTTVSPGTSFWTLYPIDIKFTVDPNPVLRTRQLHARGYFAPEIAGRMLSEFALDDKTTALILFDDLRAFDLFGSTRAIAPPPFSAIEIVDALATPQSAGGYGDGASAAAAALKSLHVFDVEQIVNALASSDTLRPSSADMLAAVQGPLGITNLQQAITYVANAQNASGGGAFDADQVLAGILQRQPGITPAQMLTLLHVASPYSVTELFTAVLHSAPAVTDMDIARAAVVIADLAIDDIKAALKTVYGVSDPTAEIRQAVSSIVAASCALYEDTATPGIAAALASLLRDRGGLSASSVLLLLSASPPSGCAFSATQLGYVLADGDTFNLPGRDFVGLAAQKYSAAELVRASRAVFAADIVQAASWVGPYGGSPATMAQTLLDNVVPRPQATGVADALQDGLAVRNVQDVADVLAALTSNGPAYSAAQVWRALANLRAFDPDSYTDPTAALDVLKRAGYAATDSLDALRADYSQAQLVDAGVRYFNFAIADVKHALQLIYPTLNVDAALFGAANTNIAGCGGIAPPVNVTSQVVLLWGTTATRGGLGYLDMIHNLGKGTPCDLSATDLARVIGPGSVFNTGDGAVSSVFSSMYSPAEISSALANVYGDSAATIASLLNGHFSALDILEALRSTASLHVGATALFNIAKQELGVALNQQVVALLHDLGIPASDTLAALINAAGDQGAQPALSALAAAGFAPGEAIGALAALEPRYAQLDHAEELAQTVLGLARWGMTAVRAALRSVYGDVLNLADFLINSAEDLVRGSCSAYIPTSATGAAGVLAHLLQRAGLSAVDAMTFLSAPPGTGCAFSPLQVAWVVGGKDAGAYSTGIKDPTANDPDAATQPGLTHLAYVTAANNDGFTVAGASGVGAALRRAFALPIAEAATDLAKFYDKTLLTQALSDSYFPVGTSLLNVATGLGGALSSLPLSVIGTSPLGLVNALAKTISDRAGTGSITSQELECLTAVGTLSGTDYSLTGMETGSAPGDSLLATLGSSSVTNLLPSPLSTGTGGNMGALGQCLVTNGLGNQIRVPLKTATVTYEKFSLPGTTLDVPEGIMTGRAGWALNVAGLKVPTLPGGLDSLPVFATDAHEMYGHGSDTFDISDFNCLYRSKYCDNRSVASYVSSSLIKTVDGNGDSPADHASLTFVLPDLLPDQLLLSGAFYSGPNGAGADQLTCSSTADVLHTALAAALPPSLYPTKGDMVSAYPDDNGNSKNLTLTTGTTAFTVGGTQTHHCGRTTSAEGGDGSLSGHVTVTPITDSNAVDSASSLRKLANFVTVPDQTDLPGSVSTLVELTLFNTLSGNFLSLMSAGGSGLTGGALAAAMARGYVPGT